MLLDLNIQDALTGETNLPHSVLPPFQVGINFEGKNLPPLGQGTTKSNPTTKGKQAGSSINPGK